MSFLLGVENDEFPALRLASLQDIHEALGKLAPVAGAKRPDEKLDFDLSGLGRRETVSLIQMAHIEAERTCGALLHELDYRDKHWDLTTPEGEQKAADEWNATKDAFIARCERKLAELEAEETAQAEARA